MHKAIFKIMALLSPIIPNFLKGFLQNLNSQKIKKEA